MVGEYATGDSGVVVEGAGAMMRGGATPGLYMGSDPGATACAVGTGVP